MNGQREYLDYIRDMLDGTEKAWNLSQEWKRNLLQDLGAL